MQNVPKAPSLRDVVSDCVLGAHNLVNSRKGDHTMVEKNNSFRLLFVIAWIIGIGCQLVSRSPIARADSKVSTSTTESTATLMATKVQPTATTTATAEPIPEISWATI